MDLGFRNSKISNRNVLLFIPMIKVDFGICLQIKVYIPTVSNFYIKFKFCSLCPRARTKYKIRNQSLFNQ